MIELLNEPETTPLPDFYEVVNGEVIEVEQMSNYAAEVANRLLLSLASYGMQRKNGDRGWTHFIDFL